MELVFEIGCEDLPARFVEPGLEQLEEQFAHLCDEQRLDFEGVETVGTPRRLALLVEEVAERQEDLEEEQTGPPIEAAYEDGEPTDAARGFARAQGVEVGELYEVEKDHGEYVAAEVREEGKSAVELLPELLRTTVESLTFPKSMRWAAHEERFGRPVRWMLAVAGGETLEFDFAGVTAGSETVGHRFAAPEGFEVTSIDDYLDGLAEAHVEPDPEVRRDQIRSKLDELAAEVGGTVVDDPELVDEVVHLVEEVHATRLDFSEDYLELPDAVLIESMRSHQRYFAFAEEGGDELLSYCGVIYNTPVEDPEVVTDGNLRVLRARLDDAQFFWNKDLQRPLEARLPDLSKVVWIEEVGSMRERSVRLGKTAERVAGLMGASDDVREHAHRAGLLSKADLVTEMVDEFPSLEGTMGRAYALEDGEPKPVADAIGEQYLPEGQGDDLPASETGTYVALAEKADALVGCFGVGMEPTASADPYGLRRAALGIIRILEERETQVALRQLVEAAFQSYARDDDQTLTVDRETLLDRVVGFVERRLKYHLSEDYATDVVDAVLAAETDDVEGVRGRVEALTELRREADFEPLALGFKRVVNILDQQVGDERGGPFELDEKAFVESEERALCEAYRETTDQVATAMDERDWEAACRALVDLKDPIDDFFDAVMVIAEDEAVRQNRLALLDELRVLFRRVADISRIQVD